MQTPPEMEPSFILAIYHISKPPSRFASISAPNTIQHPSIPIFKSVHNKRIYFLQIYFLRKEQPSVSLAFPPVGWHSTVEQPPQMTTVWACEKTVVMVKQPGHLTSMKKERGTGTRVCLFCFFGQVCVFDSSPLYRSVRTVL